MLGGFGRELDDTPGAIRAAALSVRCYDEFVIAGDALGLADVSGLGVGSLLSRHAGRHEFVAAHERDAVRIADDVHQLVVSAEARVDVGDDAVVSVEGLHDVDVFCC